MIFRFRLLQVKLRELLNLQYLPQSDQQAVLFQLAFAQKNLSATA